MKPLFAVTMLGVLAATVAAADPPKPPSLVDIKLLTAEANATPLRKLQIERFNAGIEELKIYRARADIDPRNLSVRLESDCASRIAAAAVDVFQQRAERISVLERYVQQMKNLESIVKMRALERPADVLRASSSRAQAELLLTREKAKPGKPDAKDVQDALEEMRDTAKAELKLRRERAEIDPRNLASSETLDCVRRLTTAELALAKTHDERIKVLERSVEMHREHEKILKARLALERPADNLCATYHRASAEIELQREKEKGDRR